MEGGSRTYGAAFPHGEAMILGIDSTTEHLHLALVTPHRHWAHKVQAKPGRTHSHVLLPEVEALLAQAEAQPSALTGVVACVGPGGFTALRIGVASAEGLALTGLPTWGFSAFELRAKALQCSGFRDTVWILLDGQRQEAFVQPWKDTPCQEGARCPLPQLQDYLGGQPWWAPQPFRTKVEAHLGPCPVHMADEDGATLLGLVALCRARSAQAPESPLRPFYLRETDAEVNFPQASTHLSPALRRGHAR